MLRESRLDAAATRHHRFILQNVKIEKSFIYLSFAFCFYYRISEFAGLLWRISGHIEKATEGIWMMTNHGLRGKEVVTCQVVRDRQTDIRAIEREKETKTQREWMAGEKCDRKKASNTFELERK